MAPNRDLFSHFVAQQAIKVLIDREEGVDGFEACDWLIVNHRELLLVDTERNFPLLEIVMNR